MYFSSRENAQEKIINLVTKLSEKKILRNKAQKIRWGYRVKFNIIVVLPMK